MQFARSLRFARQASKPAIDQPRNVKQREKSTQQKQPKLNRIGPDDRLDTANVCIKERKNDKEENRPEDRITGAQAEEFVTEHQFDRDARNIDADAGGEGLADQKKTRGRFLRRRTEGVGEQLIRRIDLAFEI